MVRVLANVGDYFAMSLSNGKLAFAQYVYRHHQYGTLVQVFDLVTEREVSVKELSSAAALFPPVFVGVNPPLRAGKWRIIGRLPVENFQFPKFRCTQNITHTVSPGCYDDWLIWDGESYKRVGRLPAQYRKAEYLCAWGTDDLHDRIMRGGFHEEFDRMT